MLILFLMKPPAATGRSHSLTTFACPGARPPTDRFAEAQASTAIQESGRGAIAERPLPMDGLSWTEICLDSIAARSMAGGAYELALRPDIIHIVAV